MVLASFFVDEECQQQGYGKFLFNLACAHADVLGATHLAGSAHPTDPIKGVSNNEDSFDKEQQKIVGCRDSADGIEECIDCEDCLFNNTQYCFESDKIEWLCKEYEPPVLLNNELELINAISKATNKEYKYLAKQKGKIYLFTNKPLVHRGTFGNSYTSNNYYAYISDKDETLFQNIKNEIGIYDIENKIFI